MHSFSEKDKKYQFFDNKGDPYFGSNFVMQNPYLIKGSAPKRIIEAENEFGEKVTFEISSNDFASLQKFKGIIEGKGNYIWHGTNTNLSQVKSSLYRKTKSTDEIRYLGYNPEQDIYSFSNGVFIEHGTFIPADENGFCLNGDKSYYLPFESKINQDDGSFENFRKFRHVERKDVSFEAWAKLFVDVYGKNGMLALGYLICSLFRDVVYEHLRFYPHLFLFGPPQSGKSALSESMQYLFGHPQAPINLEAGSTAIGSFRKLEQLSNAIIAVNEYRNTIDPKLIGMLKATYDNQGRETGQMSNDNRTKSSKVRSALVTSGQDLPTNDPALFSRVVPLTIIKRDSYSDQEKALFDKLQEMQKKGLTSVLVDVLQYRNLFKDKFQKVHSAHIKRLKKYFAGKVITERCLLNYAIIPTAVDIFRPELNIPFSEGAFEDAFKSNITEYLDLLNTSTDVNTFWDTIEYLHSKGTVNIDVHFTLKVVDSKYEALCLNWKSVYPEYREHMIRQHKRPLGDKTLVQYLKNTTYYTDYKKTRFQSKNCWAHWFRLSEIDINLK